MVMKTSPHELQQIFSRVGKERGVDVPEPQIAGGDSWLDEIDRQEQNEINADRMGKLKRKKTYAFLIAGFVASLLVLKLVTMAFDYVRDAQLISNLDNLIDRNLEPTIPNSLAQAAETPSSTEAALFGGTRKAKEGLSQEALALQEAANTPLDQREESQSDIGNILKENIKGKVQQLSEREQQLKTFEAMLRVTEEKLAERQKALVDTRDEIKGLLDDYNETKEGERGHLVGIYSSLDPKRAALIFNNLDTDIIVGLINQMSPRKSAQIIGYMLPNKAKEITEVLSGRQTQQAETQQSNNINSSLDALGRQ